MNNNIYNTETFKSTTPDDDFLNKLHQLYFGEPITPQEAAKAARDVLELSRSPKKHKLADLMVRQEAKDSLFERYTVDVPSELTRYKCFQDMTNGNISNMHLYLGDFLTDLGDNVIVDKTCTGCGGTTLALNQSGKDIIIAMPTRNTVECKEIDELGNKRKDVFVIHGEKNNSREAVYNYLTSLGRTKEGKKRGIEWKNIKIVCTHEILGKLAEWLRGANGDGYPISEKDPCYFNESGNLENYHLYIDEMHSLLDVHGSENLARIHKMLAWAKTLHHVVFITATMTEEEYYPQEVLDMADRLKLVKINFPKWAIYTPQIKTLVCKARRTPAGYMASIIKSNYLSTDNEGENVHIFLNSVKNIVAIMKKISWLQNISNIRIVCSQNNGDNEDAFYKAFCDEYKKDDVEETELLNQYLNKEIPLTSPITSEVRKVNFYTATAFQGCDILDAAGQIYVVSSKYQAQTMYDVATTIPQIIGRIRDYAKPYVYYIRDDGKGIMTWTEEEFTEELKEREEAANQQIKNTTMLHRDYNKGLGIFDFKYSEYFIAAKMVFNPETQTSETQFVFDDLAFKHFKRAYFNRLGYINFSMMRKNAETLTVENEPDETEQRLVSRTVNMTQRGTFKEKYAEYCALAKEEEQGKLEGKRKLAFMDMEKTTRYNEIRRYFTDEELEDYKWSYKKACYYIRSKAVLYYKKQLFQELKRFGIDVGAQITRETRILAEKWATDTHGIEDFHLKDIYEIDSTSIVRRVNGKSTRFITILGKK